MALLTHFELHLWPIEYKNDRSNIPQVFLSLTQSKDSNRAKIVCIPILDSKLRINHALEMTALNEWINVYCLLNILEKLLGVCGSDFQHQIMVILVFFNCFLCGWICGYYT